MIDARRRPHALLTLALALGTGCSDGSGGGGGVYSSVPQQNAGQTLGGELCRLMLDRCDCQQPQEIFASVSECSNAMSAELDAHFAEAQAAGLTYHPECMAEHINLYTQTIQCSTLSELLDDPALMLLDASPCKVHSGGGQVGDACTPYYQALGDTCAQGLQCFETCVEIPDDVVIRAEGEACEPQTEVCESGSACQPPADDPLGATTCIRLPGAGEPCTIGCQEGLSCDLPEGATERTCLAPPGAGEPCGSYPDPCAADLFCDSSTDTCTQILAEGTACDDDDQCGEGMVCREADDGSQDVCRPEEPLVCF